MSMGGQESMCHPSAGVITLEEIPVSLIACSARRWVHSSLGESHKENLLKQMSSFLLTLLDPHLRGLDDQAIDDGYCICIYWPKYMLSVESTLNTIFSISSSSLDLDMEADSTVWVQSLVLPPTSSVTLGKWPSFSVLQFSYLYQNK